MGSTHATAIADTDDVNAGHAGDVKVDITRSSDLACCHVPVKKIGRKTSNIK